MIDIQTLGGRRRWFIRLDLDEAQWSIGYQTERVTVQHSHARFNYTHSSLPFSLTNKKSMTNVSQSEAETMTMLTNQSPVMTSNSPDLTIVQHSNQQLVKYKVACFQCQRQAAGKILKLWLAHPDQQAGFFSIENPQAGPL